MLAPEFMKESLAMAAKLLQFKESDINALSVLTSIFAQLVKKMEFMNTTLSSKSKYLRVLTSYHLSEQMKLQLMLSVDGEVVIKRENARKKEKTSIVQKMSLSLRKKSRSLANSQKSSID
jgi:hypothetical protein